LKALVTGSAGQVGRYLVELLADSADIVALDRASAPTEVYSANARTVRFLEGDILHFEFMRDLLATESFDVVFHLAGLNSFAPTADIYHVNVVGAATLLHALSNPAKRTCKVVIMSSSAVYGATTDEPIYESSALAPLTHYGVSKHCIEMMAGVASAAAVQDIIIARPFNIVGPGQRAPMLHSTVATQLVKIERNLQPPTLQLGILSDYRDFVDVRDVATGLMALAEHGRPGEAYNLCTGRAVQVRALVEGMCALCEVHVEIIEDNLNRPRVDVPHQRGSYEKIREASGWIPKIPLATSLDDTLAFWRGLLQNPPVSA
jgi:GDP-4-dehydro-6-deoxy-D-mannose reductase